MKFAFSFNKTTLFIAIEKGNLGIIQLLLDREEIDVNEPSIFTCIFIQFKTNVFIEFVIFLLQN